MEQSKQALSNLTLVATPIGNLKDISLRALEVLRSVDVIYCEDTRITIRLLQAYEIKKPLKNYHEHNAASVRPYMIDAMLRGEKIALVSDAGTPLISDPGFKLVQSVQQSGLCVSIIPGACAAVSALAVSGLPTDRFMFCGFLPAKQAARSTSLVDYKDYTCTLIYYESAQRLLDCLRDIQAVMGDRRVSVIRELTKKFEEVFCDDCSKVIEYFTLNPARGELVLCVEGCKQDVMISQHWQDLVHSLVPHHTTKDLVALLEQVSPYSRAQMYEYIIQSKKKSL